jgi:hypothetical protein
MADISHFKPSQTSAQMADHHLHWRRESFMDVYNLALAAFLFVSPWLFALTRGEARADIWISSAAIALTAIAAMLTYANWKEWLNVLLGAWLIGSPWVLGFAHTRAMHFSIAIGCAVVFMALVELLVVNYPPEQPD